LLSLSLAPMAASQSCTISVWSAFGLNRSGIEQSDI
jgi:hypothetical protein